MKRIFCFLSILLFISCGTPENSPEFIKATQGRYLFNSNDVIEISYVGDTMNVKWRGQDIVPLKIGDSTFFLKELNEKFVFVTEPEVYIQLEENKRFKGRNQKLPKLQENEKTPGEYLENKEYDKALESYLAIQKRDSLDNSIDWDVLNTRAHKLFDRKEKEKAFELFKINIALYPNKPAAYRNYGYVLMQEKDTANAIVNYRKALAIDPDDYRALSFFERIQKSSDD
jgi:tetratricopeptide (TPR) repeat protein